MTISIPIEAIHSLKERLRRQNDQIDMVLSYLGSGDLGMAREYQQAMRNNVARMLEIVASVEPKHEQAEPGRSNG